MSLALSKGTCGRTFGMANQSGGRAILCRRRASGRHHMDKTGRKTGNQWLTKAGNDKEDTYAMACILLKSIGAPGRNRTHGPQLRRLLLYPTELRNHRQNRTCGDDLRRKDRNFFHNSPRLNEKYRFPQGCNGLQPRGNPVRGTALHRHKPALFPAVSAAARHAPYPAEKQTIAPIFRRIILPGGIFCLHLQA